MAGSVALVTGAAQGIGRGIAGHLAAGGARVVLLDVNAEGAELAAEEINRARGDRCAISCGADVASAADVSRAFALSEEAFGPVSLLVNNAGVARLALIEQCPDEQWDEVFGVHMRGTFLCTREYARRRTSSPGAVVNISSVNGDHGPTEGAAHYCAAKAAIAQFTKVAALELAPRGIRVNAVSPGATMTPMAQANARMHDAFVERTPLGRFGEVDDIARVVVFLLSPEAGWITGVTIPVDGGLHMRGVHNFHAVLTESQANAQSVREPEP
jgi:3-oxoacyl-[acyl-carrier protein] reductase